MSNLPDRPHLVDLVVFHHPLHVAARLGEGDALDPVDHLVDVLAARIAIALDPFLGAARTGIVAGEGQHIGAVEAAELLAEECRAERRVVAGIGGQPSCE